MCWLNLGGKLKAKNKTSEERWFYFLISGIAGGHNKLDDAVLLSADFPRHIKINPSAAGQFIFPVCIVVIFPMFHPAIRICFDRREIVPSIFSVRSCGGKIVLISCRTVPISAECYLESFLHLSRKGHNPLSFFMDWDRNTIVFVIYVPSTICATQWWSHRRNLRE